MTSTATDIKDTIATIWSLLNSSERKMARIFVAFSLVATLLEMLSLGMIFPLLYSFSSKTQSANLGLLGSAINSDVIKNLSITQISIFLMVLFLAKNIFLVFLARFQAKFVFGIEESISNLLYKSYLNEQYLFFVKRNSAELIRNIMREASQFAHNAISPLCLLVTESLIAFGIMAILVAFNPIGALVSFTLFGGAGCIFYSFVRKRIVQWGKEHQFHEGKRLQTLQEGFGSVKEVLIGALQSKFISAYTLHMKAGVMAGVNQQTVQAAPRLFIEVFAIIVLGLAIIIFGASESDAFWPIMGLYAAAAFRLMPGINRIINALQALKYSQTTVLLLAKELPLGDDGPSTFSNSNNGDKLTFSEKIELKNLFFSFPGAQRALLNNLKLEINKGDVVFLTGQSGSGKTTLVDIICGLQEPTSGEILVDGVRISSCIANWQKCIAYVPQTTFLLDGTIQENIIFGDANSQVDTKKLMKICQVAGVDEIVSKLPAGLQTHIGERGGNLSGGQRQRIGIARALYRGGELLVLDESTNSLDPDLEDLIIKDIFQYSKQKKITVICITHNKKFINYGDGVIEIQNSAIKLLTKKTSR